MKQIAQRNNTLIFAIHHLNKASASQGTVGLHSLKGSSNVVQKADKVIVLKGNRNEIYRTVMSEKSRDDGKLEFVTEFHPETMTFKRIEVWKRMFGFLDFTYYIDTNIGNHYGVSIGIGNKQLHLLFRQWNTGLISGDVYDA